jgi:hypothetical protein
VLPFRKAVVGITAGAGFATREFLPNRKLVDYSLDGTFRSYDVELLGRVGVGMGFELSLKLDFKGVSYVADSVLLVDDQAAPGSPDGYRDAVFNFSSHEIGMADIHLGVAHQHLKGPVRLASALELKLPSGYRVPDQTFRDTEFGSQNISDDVTLGDGQVDLEYSLQLGAFLGRTRTALELNAGYRVRFNGPGHQAIGLFKVGQFVTRYLLLYASVDAAVTVFDGEVIGKTFVAIDPRVPARRFPVSNVEKVDYSLDRDQLTVGGGAILRVLDREWVLRVAHTPWGKNTAALTSVSLGVILPFGDG